MSVAVLWLAALGACLLVVSVEDLRHRRIPNTAILVLLALATAHLVEAHGNAAIVPHLILATAMFAVFLLAYAAGLMGGGDTKLLAVAMLWLGPDAAALFALLLFAAALVVAIIMWSSALVTRRQVRGQGMPFGVPIAFAWMVAALLDASR